jgi:glycerol-3-phosphate acyltransferase PlsY
MKKRERLLITDWHILRSWEKGIALGAIIGALIIIPLSFIFNKPDNIYFLPLVFIICILIIAIIFHYSTQKK